MKATKKTVSLLIIAALALCFCSAALILAGEDAHAAVSKAAVKKAKTYKKATKKLFKVKGSWYCFSKKKVRKGLQKVGKNYYFFSKKTGKMYLKTGLKKVGTSYYYFKKKSGKAPALKNKALTLDGKVWFFKSTGKRYPYSYKTTGTASGNTAAGYIISAAKLKPADKATTAQLQAAYKKIVSRSSYKIVIANPITSQAMAGSYALSCAKDKGGKCYHMAALTFVTFKALGASPSLVTGKCSRTGDLTKAQEHAWVEESKLVYDSVFDVTLTKKAMTFMGKTMDALHGKDYKNHEFKLKDVTGDYSNYIYIPDKTNTFK